MTHSVLPFGTQIAHEVRDPSANSTNEVQDLKTLGDLLHIFGKNPPRDFAAMRTACTWLAVYLDKATDQITIDAVDETRDGFRQFLESRTFAENTIRKYVDSVRGLLKNAKELGWRPDKPVPEEWRAVLGLAEEKKCDGLAKGLARIGKVPREVTIDDVDRWVQEATQHGFSYQGACNQKYRFWRLLRECGCTEQVPKCILRGKGYGISLAQFPQGLRREVLELLRWKQAEFAAKRPKGGRLRPVTAKRLQSIICSLFGFAINIRGESEIASLSQLVQEQVISGYSEWCINERKHDGYAFQCSLRLLSAAMRQHPSYASIDFSWFKPLVDSIPVVSEAEVKKRKASKYLEYSVVELIPARIHSERTRASKRGIRSFAGLAMAELLIKWLITLVWRQRNIRECRIGGPTPNLFKSKIDPFSDIDKPEWVKLEEQRNPTAEFSQIPFNSDETKL